MSHPYGRLYKPRRHQFTIPTIDGGPPLQGPPLVPTLTSSLDDGGPPLQGPPSGESEQLKAPQARMKRPIDAIDPPITTDCGGANGGPPSKKKGKRASGGPPKTQQEKDQSRKLKKLRDCKPVNGTNARYLVALMMAQNLPFDGPSVASIITRLVKVEVTSKGLTPLDAQPLAGHNLDATAGGPPLDDEGNLDATVGGPPPTSLAGRKRTPSSRAVTKCGLKSG